MSVENSAHSNGLGAPAVKLRGQSWIGRVTDKIILWVMCKFFSWLLVIFLCIPYRKRMSHDNGIAGIGWFRVFDDATFPEHDFFERGKKFPVRIRHATATYLDDAVRDIRAISLKLSHEHFNSPFDIELNTGKQSLFWNVVSFLKFAFLRREKYAIAYVEYLRKYPEGLEGAKYSLRLNSTSFNNLRYYSQTVFLFIGKDGIKRYAKYRIVSYNYKTEPETGLVDHDYSETDASNQRILPFEKRGRNYLKYEYEDRVAKEGAHYRFQIQLHQASDDDDPEICNNMVLWDEKLHPWQDLAEFKIEKTLDWKESILTTFSVNNMPKNLGILPATSIYDYNSLNYLRGHSEVARKARLMSVKIFGMVPPIPDNDNRNAEDWGV